MVLTIGRETTIYLLGLAQLGCLTSCSGHDAAHTDEPAAIQADQSAIPCPEDAATGLADGGVAPGHDGGSHAGECATFTSSYEAIQKLIFERKGCTAAACHGAAKVGGLDLRAEVSWESLVDAPSANSKNALVQPGTAYDSYLYQKLRAATEPGSVAIAGSPMPVGTAPLSADELEAVRLWIVKGAPKTGVVQLARLQPDG